MLNVKFAFTVLLMVTVLGIAACSDDDGDEGGTTTGAKEAGTPAGEEETGTSAQGRANPDQDALGST
jgi:hypothetical protein